MPPEAGAAAPAADAKPVPTQPRLCFGVALGGVNVLLPAGVITEFVAQAPIYPVPRAPTRLLGLMQVRGHPVPVFDAAPQASDDWPALGRHDVLLIGTGAEAGAVAVDAPPRAISPLPVAAPGDAPECCFGDALTDPHVDPAEPGLTWWLLAPRRLFEVLSTPADAP